MSRLTRTARRITAEQGRVDDLATVLELLPDAVQLVDAATEIGCNYWPGRGVTDRAEQAVLTALDLIDNG